MPEVGAFRADARPQLDVLRQSYLENNNINKPSVTLAAKAEDGD